MSYRPNKRSAEFEVPPNGNATLTLLAGKKIGVHFSPENKNDWADKKFTVVGWPEFMKPKLVGNTGREFYVKLNNDHNEIYTISPLAGMYQVRFAEFSHREGEAPVPEWYDKGKYEPYHRFTALLEVVGGDEAAVGMTKPYLLRYYFGEDQDGNAEYTNWGASAKYAPQLDEFLTTFGCWDYGSMKFSDNLLPEIQKRLLQANKKATIIVNRDGWIDNVVEIHEPKITDVVDDPGWEDVTEPQPIAEATTTPAPEFEQSQEKDVDW